MLCDVAQQAVLNLVPLAGARREVADVDAPPRLVSDLLLSVLPHARANSVATARKRRRVVVTSDSDPCFRRTHLPTRLRQRRGELRPTLARPPQRRLRVAASQRVNQLLQRLLDAPLRLLDGGPSNIRAASPTALNAATRQTLRARLRGSGVTTLSHPTPEHLLHPRWRAILWPPIHDTRAHRGTLQPPRTSQRSSLRVQDCVSSVDENTKSITWKSYLCHRHKALLPTRDGLTALAKQKAEQSLRESQLVPEEPQSGARQISPRPDQVCPNSQVQPIHVLNAYRSPMPGLFDGESVSQVNVVQPAFSVVMASVRHMSSLSVNVASLHHRDNREIPARYREDHLHNAARATPLQGNLRLVAAVRNNFPEDLSTSYRIQCFA